MLQEKRVRTDHQSSTTVIADESVVAEGIVSLLREGGFSVTVVAGGDDWRHLIESQPERSIILFAADDGQRGSSLVRGVLEASPQGSVVVVNGPMRRHGHSDGDAGRTSRIGDDQAAPRAISESPAVNASPGRRGRPAGDRLLKGELAAGTVTLTTRESTILRLIAQGESNRGIGEQLSISEHTVRAHARSIMQKLAVKNRIEAAVVALRTGLAN